MGGSLGLVSWPGYGTDVHIHLPRVDKDQREVVPDQDHHATSDGWTRESVEGLLAEKFDKNDMRVKSFVDWAFDAKKVLRD